MGSRWEANNEKNLDLRKKPQSDWVCLSIFYLGGVLWKSLFWNHCLHFDISRCMLYCIVQNFGKVEFSWSNTNSQNIPFMKMSSPKKFLASDEFRSWAHCRWATNPVMYQRISPPHRGNIKQTAEIYLEMWPTIHSSFVITTANVSLELARLLWHGSSSLKRPTCFDKFLTIFSTLKCTLSFLPGSSFPRVKL